MEYKEGAVEHIFPYEYEQASNSYLMGLVAAIAGLPLPVINLIASAIFYLGQRRSTYFVRWHALQALIGQALLVPFNSIFFAWTFGILWGHRESGTAYWIYFAVIAMVNFLEFIAVAYAASRVRKGHDVRWAIIAGITDSLCSTENRDPFIRK